MEEFIISSLLDGRPETIKSEKEKECYDTLDKLGIEYSRVEYNFFPSEKENLELIDKTLGVSGIKNLMFRKKSGGEYYFVILDREDRFDEKAFRLKFNLSKITMAKPEDLENLLGTYSGAVSVMELIKDRDNLIGLYIDSKILNREYLRFHPNENTSTVRISMEDFKTKLIPYLGHSINEI